MITTTTTTTATTTAPTTAATIAATIAPTTAPTTATGLTTATGPTTAGPREVFLHYVDGFNRGDHDVIEDAIHPDFVDRHVPAEIPIGPAGAALWWQILSAAFTLEIAVDEILEAGDRLATRCTLRGTHIGEFAGLPATGRDFEMAMMSIERFAEGRIVERWEVYDGLSMLTQLGFDAPA